MQSIQPKYTAHNLNAKQWQRTSALSRGIWSQIVPEDSRPLPFTSATFWASEDVAGINKLRPSVDVTEIIQAVCDELYRCFRNGNELAARYASTLCEFHLRPAPDWVQSYHADLDLAYMTSNEPRDLVPRRHGRHGGHGLVRDAERDAYRDIAYSLAELEGYSGSQRFEVAGQIWEDIINAPDVGGSMGATGKTVQTGGSTSNIEKLVKKTRNSGQPYRQLLPRSMLSDIVTQCCASFVSLQDRSLLIPPAKN